MKDSEDNGKQEWREPSADQLRRGLYKGQERSHAEKVGLAMA